MGAAESVPAVRPGSSPPADQTREGEWIFAPIPVSSQAIGVGLAPVLAYTGAVHAATDAYLASLTDEELSALVAEAVAETGAAGPKAMGQVMKVLTPKIAGRAEGARVAAAVRSALS